MGTSINAASGRLPGNFLKITGHEGFSSGNRHHLALMEYGLTLSPGKGEGEYLSPIYQTDRWNDLVLSWNSDTPPGTGIEAFARGWLPRESAWTDWISWGVWSPFLPRACPPCADSRGWAWANSYAGMGDSTMNLREGLTATKIQLKIRLFAGNDAPALPVLRLLAAAWKNTNDPHWQSNCTLTQPIVPQKGQVLLDIPSISQKTRDPDYADVICSPTCVAMALNGLGTPVLPEDVALLSYDYGYGGNGNWSFSVAAAGAYGHESYVHYSSFEDVRQQLSCGYPVILSVKYCPTQGGQYPYLANAPITTGGHLIALVGYTYSEALGEYIYFSNDPAAPSDRKAARRQYRQSQLDQAWYRRAAYFIRSKVPGAGDWSRIRGEGTLRLLPNQQGIYALLTHTGERIPLPMDFLKDKRRAFGFRGSLCLLAEGESRLHYNAAVPTPDGYIEIRPDLAVQMSNGRRMTLFLITTNGYLWTATHGFAGSTPPTQPCLQK